MIDDRVRILLFTTELKNFTQLNVMIVNIDKMENGISPLLLHCTFPGSQDKYFGYFYKNSDKINLPLILYIYGGPHGVLIRNTYSPNVYKSVETILNCEYAVLVLETKTVSERGKIREEGFFKRMGQFEVEEHVKVANELINKYSLSIDKNTIGIYGWSYGGFLALMGISKMSNYFKIVQSLNTLRLFPMSNLFFGKRVTLDP
ncbi:hypothetical protein A3Q56_07668 [Intoshia linei]|uniref:Peptidase S9 prolyl oligopeptidase catalytic domain-containing protein n=1 Tax=Intoshia linei TaxID=1819745 RepID=A0A177AS29_9BILA|nr:hypothetical protein A3Q56_07668 [Intoshia linei]